MITKLLINITPSDKFTLSQKQKIMTLQQLCFSNVSEREARLDFYHPVSVHILAWTNDRLIGWAGVHLEETNYLGRKIRIGGYGICVHPQVRRQGLANKICQLALEYLRTHDRDIVFLSVDLNNPGSMNFHQQLGFQLMKQNFSWTNSEGKMDESSGGMLKELNSPAIFELIMNGTAAFYVGCGYW